MKKLFILLLTLMVAVLVVIEANRLKDDIVVRDDIIRLHIIANSDYPKDQALKLKVRDELLSAFSDIFKDTKGMANARARVVDNLNELSRVAQDKVHTEGYNYPVKTELDIHEFPTKVYGSVVYPAGSYEALRVIIGEGRGANWWCVMFPPLCFVDVSSGVSVDPSMEDVDTNADKADDKIEVSGGEGTDPKDGGTEYRLKIGELWEGLKSWVKGIFS